MSQITPQTKVTVTPDQVSSEVSGEIIILHVKDGMYFGLDDVGAVVWQAIQKPRRVDEIVNTMLEQFEVDREKCEADLCALLEQMVAAKLVSVENEA
ncbi:MAG TPA: PqqD family protein [Terriglobales bacterium]|nr:PqqD family protein [Terriglobales bacterium]